MFTAHTIQVIKRQGLTGIEANEEWAARKKSGTFGFLGETHVKGCCLHSVGQIKDSSSLVNSCARPQNDNLNFYVCCCTYFLTLNVIDYVYCVCVHIRRASRGIT